MLCFPPKVFIHPIPLIPSQALICVPPWFQALICVPPWFQALKMSRHFFLESPFFFESPFFLGVAIFWFLESPFSKCCVFDLGASQALSSVWGQVGGLGWVGEGLKGYFFFLVWHNISLELPAWVPRARTKHENEQAQVNLDTTTKWQETLAQKSKSKKAAKGKGKGKQPQRMCNHQWVLAFDWQFQHGTGHGLRAWMVDVPLERLPPGCWLKKIR